ncbi:hypothetical protein P8452_18695 [Trifolium repens]|jgi:hypothetical protein|nr:hypothetical protein QL285_059363 [Trifolium repens]WJX30122.1 hypothetical protein P8452_18695 [Trifolium repens]
MLVTIIPLEDSLVILSMIFKGSLWWQKVCSSGEAWETRVKQKDSTRTEMISAAIRIDAESSVGDDDDEEEEGYWGASACAMTLEDVKYIAIRFFVFTKQII